mgnify:CR=1 FL=1
MIDCEDCAFGQINGGVYWSVEFRAELCEPCEIQRYDKMEKEID